MGARGGGPHEARRGLRCHGGGLMRRRRRIGGGTRKKRERASVFDEEEEEGIGCARHWLLYTREIYSRCQPLAGSKGPLLPVRVTNRK